MNVVRLWPLLCLGFVAASPAAVLDQSAGGFTVRNTAVVPSSSARAWDALVNEIGQWWPADHTWFGDSGNLSINPVAGGCFCERDGARQAQHLIVSHVEPGKLLRMLGGLGPLQGMGVHGVLDFTLEALPNEQTRITLRHRVGGYTPDDLGAFAATVDRVQALQLQGLASHLHGHLEDTPNP